MFSQIAKLLTMFWIGLLFGKVLSTKQKDKVIWDQSGNDPEGRHNLLDKSNPSAFALRGSYLPHGVLCTVGLFKRPVSDLRPAIEFAI